MNGFGGIGSGGVRRPLTRVGFTLLLVVTMLLPTTASALAGRLSGAGEAGRSDAVLEWNANAGKAALAACIAPLDNPLHESHLYAMTHIAIHDALNAISRRSTPYAYLGHARAGSSPEAAVAAAARGVLVPVLGQLTAPFGQPCIDAGVASVEADYAAAVAAIPAGAAKESGIAVGTAAAAAILAKRDGDGADTPLLDFDYPQGSAPGEYRFTPDRPFAFAPGWRNVTPFVLESSSQFQPGPPYEITSKAYAADLNDVKALGGDGVTTPSARTPDQTQIALFWLESSPLMWNTIGRTVSRSRHLDMWQNARLFGLLNMALADGYVDSFETKYKYNFWRPVTAIRAAATDGNPLTSADPTWTPLATTPPIPDYDSAHAVEGGAAAAVFRQYFGKNRIEFSACSLTLPAGGTCNDATLVLRHFRSFSQAAEENAVSRVYVGFHFRDAAVTGNIDGGKIGTYAVKHSMLPLKERHEH